MEGLRSSAELVRAARQYAVEDRVRTWRELGLSVALWVFTAGVVVAAPSPWLRVAGSLLLGLCVMRLFIFFHDASHGSIFRGSPWGRRVTTAIAYYCLATPSTWDRDHLGHHKTVARPLEGALASYPPGEIIDRTLTVDQWASLSAADRRQVRLLLNPAVFVFGLLTTFMLAHCTLPFLENPRKHWDGPVALLSWWAAFAALGVSFGWELPVLLLLVPHFVAASLGSYIFFAQHNFAEARIASPERWHATDAALHGSSFFDMPAFMHWFTGNIGYHHVHHLNARIPFYRLPEAMAGLPELQQPGRTTWHPADILANVTLSIWDPRQQRMVSFAEADRLATRQAPAQAMTAK